MTDPSRRPVQPWQQWSAAERERQVSPSSCIGGDYRPFVQAYVDRSRAASAQAQALGGRWSAWRYGPEPSQRLDLCLPPGAGPQATVPLLVYVHGGYWQELSAQESLFAAGECIAAGAAFAALDYTLAPAATVADIVVECCAALKLLARNGPAQGIDARRIVIAGSSAGAHLAAMMGQTPDEACRGVVLVSPVTELEPLIGTTVNGALGLDASSARASSPALLPLAGFPPAVIAWGEQETDWFKSMGQGLCDRLSSIGSPCDAFEVPGRNHFDVVLDLLNPATRLGQATRRLLGCAPGPAGGQ